MKTYVINRIFHQIITLFVLIVFLFVVTHNIGDPVRIMLPDWASEEMVDATREKFGLNDPLHVQFARYLGGLMRFDFGTSIRTGASNLELILTRLPATFVLAFAGTALAAGIGLPLGALAGLKPGSLLDRAVTMLTSLAVTSLDFWIAMLLILYVSVELRLLPTSGYGELKHLVLPAVVVALRPMGRIAQVTRPAIMNEVSKQYIVALRARGVPEWKILVRHIARNAGIVLVTLTGYEFALMVNGSAIIETVFAWPGIGFLLVQAIYARDWTLILSATIFVAAVVIVLNLLVDLIYAWLDPRVRYE
jgi:peptide/nickel transport system permease protein